VGTLHLTLVSNSNNNNNNNESNDAGDNIRASGSQREHGFDHHMFIADGELS
jgi:hypothetical protein